MSRLIDADALKKKVRNECLMPDWCHVLIDVAIANMPTIEERKKGKWINGSDERFVKCSKCGMETTRNELQGIALFGKEEPNYCPNCGAVMKGENDGE